MHKTDILSLANSLDLVCTVAVTCFENCSMLQSTNHWFAAVLHSTLAWLCSCDVGSRSCLSAASSVDSNLSLNSQNSAANLLPNTSGSDRDCKVDYNGLDFRLIVDTKSGPPITITLVASTLHEKAAWCRDISQVGLRVCLFVCLFSSVCLCVILQANLFLSCLLVVCVFNFLHPSLCLSPPACILLSLSLSLTVSPSVCLSACLSVSLSLWTQTHIQYCTWLSSWTLYQQSYPRPPICCLHPLGMFKRWRS